jgi:hypothetical protein
MVRRVRALGLSREIGDRQDEASALARLLADS